MYVMSKYNVPECLSGTERTLNEFSYENSKQISWILSFMIVVSQCCLALDVHNEFQVISDG